MTETHAEERKKLRDDSIAAVPVPQPVEGTQDLTVSSGKEAEASIEQSLRLGMEIAALGDSVAKDIDLDSLQEEERQQIADVQTALAERAIEQGKRIEERTGNSNVREAGEFMLQTVEQYRETGNEKELQRAQRLADYTGFTIMTGGDPKTVREEMGNVKKIIGITPTAVSKGGKKVEALFEKANEDILRSEMEGKLGRLEKEITLLKKQAKGYLAESKKPENEEYREDYIRQVQECKNQIALLRASQALMKEAWIETKKSKKEPEKSQEHIQNARYYLRYAGDLVTIARGSSSVVEGERYLPAAELAKLAPEISKKPSILLNKKKGPAYEVMAAQAIAISRADQHLLAANDLEARARESKGLTGKQRHGLVRFIKEARELSEQARELAIGPESTMEDVDKAYKMLGIAGSRMKAVQDISEISRGVNQLDGRGKRDANKLIDSSIDLYTKANGSFAKVLETKGEEQQKHFEAYQDQAERADILLQEISVYASMANEIADARKNYVGSREGKRKHIKALQGSLKQMENGIERIKKGEEINAALKSMASAESKFQLLERKRRLNEYQFQVAKYPAGEEYTKKMEAIGLSANEILTGKGDWGKLAKEDRFVLFDRVVSAAETYELQERRILKFNKRISGFAQNKQYTLDLEAGAGVAGEIIRGEGKWGELSSEERLKKYDEIMDEAEKYASYFISSGYSTNAGAREDGTIIKGGLDAKEKELEKRTGETTLASDLCRKHQGRVLRGLIYPEKGIDVEAERKKADRYKKEADDVYIQLANIGATVAEQKKKMIEMQRKAQEELHRIGPERIIMVPGEEGIPQEAIVPIPEPEIFSTSKARARATEEMEEAGVPDALKGYATAVVKYSKNKSKENKTALKDAETAVVVALGAASDNVGKEDVGSLAIRESKLLKSQIDKERTNVERCESLVVGLESELQYYIKGTKNRENIEAALLVLKRKIESGKKRLGTLESAHNHLAGTMGQKTSSEGILKVKELEREQKKARSKLVNLEATIETLEQKIEERKGKAQDSHVLYTPDEEVMLKYNNALVLRRRVNAKLARIGKGISKNRSPVLTAEVEGKKAVADVKITEQALDSSHAAIETSDSESTSTELAILAAQSMLGVSQNLTAAKHVGMLRADPAKPQRESSGRLALGHLAGSMVMTEMGGGMARRLGSNESAISRAEKGEKGARLDYAYEKFKSAIPYVQGNNAAAEGIANYDVEYSQQDNESELQLAAWKNIRNRGEIERPNWNSGLQADVQYANAVIENEEEGVKIAAAMEVQQGVNAVRRGATGGVMDSNAPAIRVKQRMDYVLANMGKMTPEQILANTDYIYGQLEEVQHRNNLSGWAELSHLPLDFMPVIGFASIITKMAGGMLEQYHQANQMGEKIPTWQIIESVASAAALLSSRLAAAQVLGGTRVYMFSKTLALSKAYRASQTATTIYFTSHAISGFSEAATVYKETGHADPGLIQNAIFAFAPVPHMAPGLLRGMRGRGVRNVNRDMHTRRASRRGPDAKDLGFEGRFGAKERALPKESREILSNARAAEHARKRSLEGAKEKRGGLESKVIPKKGKVRLAREVKTEAVKVRAVEEAAPKEEAKSETREEKQVASFIKRYSVEWAEKTISENRPKMNETAKNRELRELALNRIAKEPVEVRTRLKEKIMKNTPKELRDSMEIEWKVYVEGMIHGANKYSPIKEIGFKPIQDKLAPEIKQDIADFLRAVSVEGPNAHGVKGGHGRFTGIIVTRQIHAGAYVGPLKLKISGGDPSLSAVSSGPFWIVLEGEANAVGGPITAKQHIAYVCPSEKYMVKTSRAVKDAYSQGMLSRTEAVDALSKLMSAAEAKEAPATSFRSQAKQNAIAREFWAERRAVAEGEIASVERFSGIKVKEVAAKPKENIVKRIRELRAKEERTGVPSIERARLERQIKQNPVLWKAAKEYTRTERVLKRAHGKEYGVLWNVERVRKKKVNDAEAAKTKAEKDLAEAEATAKPAKPAELSPGRKRAAKALDKIKRAKQRMLELGRRPKERMEIRRAERAEQVLTPDGRKRVEVPQEQAGNATRRVQDTIFKTAIPNVGMRNAIGLERGRALAENAWAEVYKGESKPTFRTVLEKDAYKAMRGKVQERFDQVVDYAWRDTIREKTKLIKGTKKPSRINEAEVVVYLRMKKIFNTIWEANVKRKGMNKKSVERMIKPQELAADYRGYLQRGAGMPKEMLAKVKEMGIETTITDRKFVTNVKKPSGITVFGDLHGDHICPVTALKEVGFVIDTRPDLAVSDTSVLPKDRYIKNKEIPPGTQFIFLGDYIDRGPHSLYTVDFVQWLKAEVGALKNGSHVHTIRGNHEAIFTRVFNKYKNKSTADVKGLIEQIETHQALKNEGKELEANKLRDSGRLGEFRKEGLWLERVGTETLLKEILDRYGTWENAVVEMQKEGGLMHFIENTKAAVIVESGEGNHFCTHGGPVIKTPAREADGTVIRTVDGKIIYNEIKNVEELNRHYEDFFKDDLNPLSQNASPTDSKMYEKYEQNMRRQKEGDYSALYGGIPNGGWMPSSPTSKIGENLHILAKQGFVAVHVGHQRAPGVWTMSSLNFRNGKSITTVGHDSSLSGAYMDPLNWEGGITHSRAWGPGKKDMNITGRKDKPGVVEKPSKIQDFESPVPEMENPYTEAWNRTEGAKQAIKDITVPIPTRVPVPAMAPPAPKVAVPKAPIQKPAGIMPKRPTQPVPGGKRIRAKQIAQAKAVKKGYQEMPENITKWVDPETGLPWSKLVEYMENGNYSKTFTLPVEIKGKTGEWIVTIEGATRVTGEEMYWYTVSSSPANINYRPGQTTGAVVLQKGANLKHLITKNIQRSFEQTGSGKKTKE